MNVDIVLVMVDLGVEGVLPVHGAGRMSSQTCFLNLE